MQNKKLTNVKQGTDDSDALTKKQIYDHIKANGGDSSSTSIDLTDYLKKRWIKWWHVRPFKNEF